MTKSLPEIRRDNLNTLARVYTSLAEINEKLGRPRRDPYLFALAKGLKNSNGTPRAPGTKLCLQLEKVLNLPAGWMSRDNSDAGTVNMSVSDSIGAFNSPQTPEPDPMPTTAPCGFVKVPRLVLFGGIELYGDHIYLDRRGFEHRFPGRDPAEFRGLVVSGDSMRPSFCDGDRLLIDTARAAACPGVYVIEIDGRYLLRRLKADVSGAVQITADGLPGEAMPLDPERVKIIGRAVFVWRGEML